MKINYALNLIVLVAVTSSASASLVGRDMFYRFPGETAKDAERKAGQPVPGTRPRPTQSGTATTVQRTEEKTRELNQEQEVTISGYLRSGFGGLLIASDQGTFNVKLTSGTRGASGLVNRLVEATGTLKNGNFLITSLEPFERNARSKVSEEVETEVEKPSSSKVTGKLSVLKSKRQNQPNIYFLELPDGEKVQVDISSKVDVENLVGQEITAKIKVREDGSWKIRSGAATCKTVSRR